MVELSLWNPYRCQLDVYDLTRIPASVQDANRVAGIRQESDDLHWIPFSAFS